MKSQVVVIGAGAMGLLYAGLLARHSAVTLLDGWRAQIDALRSAGLTLTGIGGTLRPPITAVHLDDLATLRDSADIVIALTGAGESRQAADAAAVVLRPHGYLLTLQNGVGNIEAFEATLGAGRVLAGLSYHSAALRQLATAEHTHQGPTWLGEVDRSKSERLAALIALMEVAGCMPRPVDDIVSYVWTKFIHNCAINAVCAVGGLRVGEIPLTPGADELQTKIVEEAVAVVKARGHTLADPDPMAAIKAFCKVKFNKPSMLQHMEASRRTEIDALNGAVVREGASLGIATPYNEAITWMVKSMEHQRITALAEPDIDYEAMEQDAKRRAG